MIIDCRADPERGAIYDVVDLDTGDALDLVWYANDATGTIRSYRAARDERGNLALVFAPDGTPSSYQAHRRVAIRLKPQFASEEQGLAWLRGQHRLYGAGSGPVP